MASSAPFLPIGYNPYPVQEVWEAVRAYNPFRDDRTSRSGRYWRDIPELHSEAYAELARAIEQAAQAGRSGGVVLWGEPGAGKSHLLERLRRDPARGFTVAPGGLQVPPDEVPEAVFAQVMEAMLEPRPGTHTPQVFALMQMLLRQQYGDNSAVGYLEARQWFRRKLLHDIRADRFATAALDLLLDWYGWAYRQQTCQKSAARVQLMRRWLGGERLSEENARLIRLPERGLGHKLSAAHGLGVIRVMARLLALQSRPVPMILVFDQVQTLPRDTIQAWARFAHEAIDGMENVVILTAEAKAELESLAGERVIPAGSWDRISGRVVEVPGLDRAQARILLAARLDPALEPLAADEGVRAARGHDSIYPLGAAWLDEQYEGTTAVAARRLLRAAAKRWEEMGRLPPAGEENPFGMSDDDMTYANLGLLAGDVSMRELAENHFQARFHDVTGGQLGDPAKSRRAVQRLATFWRERGPEGPKPRWVMSHRPVLADRWTWVLPDGSEAGAFTTVYAHDAELSPHAALLKSCLAWEGHDDFLILFEDPRLPLALDTEPAQAAFERLQVSDRFVHVQPTPEGMATLLSHADMIASVAALNDPRQAEELCDYFFTEGRLFDVEPFKTMKSRM